MAVDVKVVRVNGDSRRTRQVVSAMDGNHVLVGWPQGDPKNNRDEGFISNAQLAALHNSGSEDGRIPARPFMDEAFEGANRNVLRTLLRGFLLRILRGQMTTAKALGIIGEKAVDMVKDSIRDGDWKPNAEITKAKKGSSRPLIDTEQMINSVTHKVVAR